MARGRCGYLPTACRLSISLEDLTTYGSITSLTWAYRRGCRRGDVRVVWGGHDDPVNAPRVMASCVPRRQG
jgi:hypothetical protein